MAYANGRIPQSQLVEVSDDIYLARTTAVSFLAWRAAARRDGHTLTIARPAGGYRSYATQAAMRAAFYGGNTARREWNMDPASTVPPASPGMSNHGWGTAADVWGAPLDYIIRTGRPFGWSQPFPGRDGHHMLHDAKTTGARNVKAVHVRFRAGDTPSAVAARAGVTVARLYVLNPGMPDPTRVPVGYRVRVA